MPNGKIKVEHRVTKLEGRVDSMEGNIKDIKEDVNNHIPSSIKELDGKVDSIVESINKRPTWLMTFVFLLMSFLLGLLATHFIN